MIERVIKWFAGFFQDQNQSASSKRLALFVCLFFLFTLVKGSLSGGVVNEQILYSIVAIILFCIGAITSEFFKSGIIKKEENK